MERIVILDQALLPNDGVFEFRTLTEYEVKEILATATIESCIQYPSVAVVISKKLDVQIEVRKWTPQFSVNDKAIVFVLKRIKGLLNLNAKKIRGTGFEFKLLTRIK